MFQNGGENQNGRLPVGDILVWWMFFVCLVVRVTIMIHMNVVHVCACGRRGLDIISYVRTTS